MRRQHCCGFVVARRGSYLKWKAELGTAWVFVAVTQEQSIERRGKAKACSGDDEVVIATVASSTIIWRKPSSECLKYVQSPEVSCRRRAKDTNIIVVYA